VYSTPLLFHRSAIPLVSNSAGETNKHRYVLALQSPKLNSALHHIPGLPIIHYNARGVMVLSPPSIATTRAKNAIEEERRVEGAKILDGVVDGENVVGTGAATTEVKRARKPKAPNPLSVKKKKADPAKVETGKKRKMDEEEEEKEQEEVEMQDAGRRKKKRKRGRGKGAVAAAIAEIKAGGLGGVITEDGGEGADASGDESD